MVQDNLSGSSCPKVVIDRLNHVQQAAKWDENTDIKEVVRQVIGSWSSVEGLQMAIPATPTKTSPMKRSRDAEPLQQSDLKSACLLAQLHNDLHISQDQVCSTRA